MKKIIILLAVISLLAGCGVVAPEQSIAKSELKKVKLLEEQNVQLRRIANSLGSLNAKID